MKKWKLLVALIFFGFYSNGQETICDNGSASWKNEKEAIKRIEATYFESSDSVLPQSSWMESAHFYSCDETTGYLIVKGSKGNFVHQDVPQEVWSALKDARSKGGFYMFYIKDHYKVPSKKKGRSV